MLLKILNHIPLLQCLFAYRWGVHKVAAKKFAVLLFLTSLPVIVTAFMAPVPEGDGGNFSKLMTKFADSLTVPELFVYSATFLTPILYMVYERMHDLSPTSIAEFKKVFRGFGFVLVLALLLIVLTAIAFSATKFHSGMSGTFLNYYLVEHAAVVYFFGLYCWYLTLLDGANTLSFHDTNRAVESNLANAFAERLVERGGE